MTAAAKTKAVAPVVAFAGFPKHAMGFWHELAAMMSKEWFDANKQRYQTEWVEPMTALLGEVAAALAPVYKPTKVGAPRIMRIYRDVRFSKDKTPYKTWIGGGVSLGSDAKPSDGVAVIYAHFGVGEDFIGGGLYVFDDAQMAKWRKRVADAKAGAALAKIVAALEADGYAVHGSGAFARVPKPYSADHPRAELLKMRGIVVGFPPVPKGLIHKAGFVDWIVGHARAAAPLTKWLYANVA